MAYWTQIMRAQKQKVFKEIFSKENEVNMF
jgi:hypothetical protein